MLEVKGKEVAALYELNPEQRSQGVLPHWMVYISVPSADEAAEKAKSLGGTVLMGPFDVFDSGRMTFIQDPTGATFAVWQPAKHIGARIMNEPGTLAWTELATTDTAGEFYTQLFDWTSETAEMGGGPYITFMKGEQPVGGMLPMTEEWGDVPPHWMIYFAVADCDRTVDLAASLGGRVQVPPTNIEGVGRFTMLADPQSALFSVIKLATPA